MLISEAITYCEYMTGQVVASEQLVRWLSELDGRLAFEFYRTGEWAPYDPTDDTGAELLVPFPWDGLYVHHLAAQTYFANGEYDRYENERVMSEQTLADFRSFMQRTQAALCGCGFPTDKTGGTYVTVIPEQASSLWFWIDAYSLAVKHGFSGTEEEWLASLVGPKGNDGERGADGSNFTIKGLYATYAALISAHPTGSEGDAYAVGTAEENTTYNWDVDAEEWVDIGPFRGQHGETGPAGQDGAPGQDGQDGAPGQDGVSPEVTISTITGGHSVKITDADHPTGQTFNVMDGADGQDGTNGQDGSDGVSPGVSISSITGGHSVTITDADHPGGQTFNVMDGQDGSDGTDGNDGADGVSPAVSVSSITGGHTVTITDKDHPNGQSFNVMDGTDGTDGQDGAPGPNTVTSSTTTNLTGLLAGDGSNVTTMGLDTSSLTNDNDHVPTSGVVKSAMGDMTMKFYYRVTFAFESGSNSSTVAVSSIDSNLPLAKMLIGMVENQGSPVLVGLNSSKTVVYAHLMTAVGSAQSMFINIVAFY